MTGVAGMPGPPKRAAQSTMAGDSSTSRSRPTTDEAAAPMSVPGPEEPADHGGHVGDRLPMGGRHEDRGEVGSRTDPLEELAHDLARRLPDVGVLGDGGGEAHVAPVTSVTGGRRVNGTMTGSPPSTRQLASTVP